MFADIVLFLLVVRTTRNNDAQQENPYPNSNFLSCYF